MQRRFKMTAPTLSDIGFSDIHTTPQPAALKDGAWYIPSRLTPIDPNLGPRLELIM